MLLGLGCGGPRPSRPPSTEIETTAHRAYRRLTESLAIDTRSVRGRKIVLDPGHGGGYRGATGVEGTAEADVNLAVGLFLWGLLTDAGADVHLTRTADRDFVGGGVQPPIIQGGVAEAGSASDAPALASPESLRSDLAARTALANAISPDLFLSIHHNADASGDTTRNQTLTFYRLGDPGASLDAAQAIHRHLMRNLGTASGQVMPGNYHVLRNSNAGAAVLGEPSFLTNPIFEEKLVRTDRVELEATAYFLGVVDYFARGTARVTEIAPRDTTLDAATVELKADFKGSPIDPATVEFLVDGNRLAATPLPPPPGGASSGEAAEASFTASPSGPLDNGAHELSVSARCLGGNAVPSISTRFKIRRPPAEIRAEAWPPWNGRERPGPLGVRATVRDRLGFPVADSTSVELTAPRSAVSPTRAGEAVFQIDEPLSAGGTWRVRSGAAEASAPVVIPGASPSWSGRLKDARSGEPIAGAEIRDGDGGPLLGRSAAGGGFGVRAPEKELAISAPGYLPEFLVGKWTEPVLSPVLAGVLHGRRIAVDAAGGGSEPLFVSPTGVRASDTALDVARRLGVELRRSGALPQLTRTDDRTLPPMARVEDVERGGAEWVVIIGAEGKGRVGHYPGSDRGMSLASAIAREVEAEAGIRLPVGPVVNPFLQQTSMPAVELLLPVPGDAATEEEHLDLDFRRRLARALLLALAEEAGLDLQTQGTALLTCPAEHVLVDGTTVVPTMGRSLLLRALEPLPAHHRAASLDMDGKLGEAAVFSVGPGDSVRLGLR